MVVATVKQLFTYPIKGLTPHRCNRVFLKAGHGIPGDRAFALLFADTGIEPVPDALPWMRKQHFAMQSDWPGLAALNCHYNPETAVLRVQQQGVELLAASVSTETGRQQISTFFTGYLAALSPTESARHPERAALRLVGEAMGTTRYPDREPVHISLIGQASLDQLSEWMGESVDACRFRPNVVLEGVPAWEEFSWVGREFVLGTARIAIAAPINRCLNIDVNPQSGERDLALFAALHPHLGHRQTGVLATIQTSGSVVIGDSLQDG